MLDFAASGKCNGYISQNPNFNNLAVLHVSTDVQNGKTKKENKSFAYPQIPPCQSLRPRRRLQARRLPQSGGNQLSCHFCLIINSFIRFIYLFYLFTARTLPQSGGNQLNCHFCCILLRMCCL